MKNLYLVQPNINNEGSLYLPYSSGVLVAYAFQFENIKSNYDFKEFIFTKQDIKETAARLENPAVVAFSCYMWNAEYNIDLAKEIKELFPACITIFGGPQVPRDTSYLDSYDFIDILSFGEGEVTFYKLLTAFFDGTNLNEIPDIAFRENGSITVTEKRCMTAKEIDYPSPYTEGYFDRILSDEKYKSTEFNAVLETTRGCPYNCIYCCWGNKDKYFSRFPIERVEGDLIWMAKNGITYCYCADSNFGIFDRDESIADLVVSLKKEYGYPQKFETLAAKNKDDLIFRINSKLEEVGLNKAVSLAVQSMSPEVLKIIGRQNMSVQKLSEQIKRYREAGMYTYTDLILGLPGETLDSFVRGLFEVVEAGQHCSLNVFRFEYIPNTAMYSDEFREKYKIKTIRSHVYQTHNHVKSNKYLGVLSDIVVETSSMSRADWRKAMRIAICAEGFHCLGLTRFFSVYLRKAKNISYYDFYMNMYEWIEKEGTAVKKILDTVCASIDTYLKGESDLFFHDERLGEIYWCFEEGLFMESCLEFEAFFEDLKRYLDTYFDDKELFDDLMQYQKQIITLPNKKETVIDCIYDWHDYFEKTYVVDCLYPEKKKTTLKIGAVEIDNWPHFAKEIVWYGKRNGRTINSNVEKLH